MTEQNTNVINAQRMESSALENNCSAILSIAEIVRTTLGPKGLDKLLVDEMGNRFITNDGATIVLSIKTVHPVAKMVVEIAARQEEKVGDGTTTAVVLAAEMIKEGKRLITEMNIHPTFIIRGIEIGIQRAIDMLLEMSVKTRMKDTILTQVISTAAGSRIDGKQVVSLVGQAIDILKNIQEENDKIELKKRILLINKPGLDDLVFDGIVLQKELIDWQTHSNTCNNRCLLLKMDLKEMKESWIREMKNFDDIVRMKECQKKMINEIADSICKKDVGVVFLSSPQIDEFLFTTLLSRKVRLIHVSNEELMSISFALGIKTARQISDIEDIPVESFKSLRHDEESGLFFLENHSQQRMVTIIIGGATKVTAQERWRAVKDGISASQSALKDGIVAGGGAIERFISGKLKEEKLNGGVESLGIEVVANALSGLMRQILTNAGYNGFEKMTEIRNRSGEYGIDINTGKVEDMFKAGVVDSAGIKIHALKSASEIVKAVLRIDRILIANSPHNVVVGNTNETNLKV